MKERQKLIREIILYFEGRPDRSRGRGRGFNNGPGPRSRFDDEGDVDMGGNSGGPSTSR